MTNLNIKIEKNGFTNEDVKTLKEHLQDVSVRDLKHLMKGNSFSVKKGVNGFKVSFKID